MSATQRFRDDHVEFLKQVKEIEIMLTDVESIKAKAKEISTLLARFSGGPKVHLAMEDNSLYPRLLESSDTTVKKIAASFQAEMGQIKEVYGNYAKKWLGPAAILAQPDLFKTETMQIFKALGHRIQKENMELYAAADKAAVKL